MSTKRHYDWWYTFVFLMLEFVQSIVGIVTLTTCRPALTVKFAQWYALRRLRVTAWQE